MKKGEIYEGTVETVSFPNKGIIHIGDEKIIVKNTIPGQKVRFMINKKRNGRCEGRMLEVLEKSPCETAPLRCSLYPECGGCTYQSMDYEEQLKMKLEQVKALIRESIAECSYEIPEDDGMIISGSLKAVDNSEIAPSPEITGYRNKMEFTFGDDRKGGPLTLGLHRRNSMYDILNVTDCALVHDDINIIVKTVREYFDGKFPYYHKVSHEGYLRDLLIRRSASTGEILAAVVTTSKGSADFEAFAQILLELKLEGSIAGILHMMNDSVADVVRSEKTEIIYGKDWFYEKVCGLSFKITPFSFFQTNTKGAEVLYGYAKKMIGDISGALVFDLYSGTGTIAQIISPAAKKVIAVEIVEEAVEAAKENAALNSITNCEFLCGDVLKVIDEIKERPDFLILDPPRSGIHPKATGKLIDYNAQRIVYISCKASSLANDLKSFLKAGYVVKEIKCVDMFPHTANIETVCLLSKLSEAKHHISV